MSNNRSAAPAAPNQLSALEPFKCGLGIILWGMSLLTIQDTNQNPSDLPIWGALQAINITLIFSFIAHLALTIIDFSGPWRWDEKIMRLLDLTVATRFLFTCLIGYAVVNAGTGVYLLLLNHPELRLAAMQLVGGAAIGLLLSANHVMQVYRFVKANFGDSPAEPEAPAPAFDAGCVPHQYSAHERNRHALHEAGHALSLAALERLPEVVTARVLHEADAHNLAGYVRYELPLNESIGFITWRMHCLLAGYRAESLFLSNEAGLGGHDDADKWQQMARALLRSQAHGLYYISPATPADERHNQQKMDGLLAEQIALVDEFLMMNAEVLQDLADELYRRDELTVDDLRPYLGIAKFPDGFPRVSATA